MPFKTLVIVLYISNELLIDALRIKLFFVPRQVVTTPRKPLPVVFHLCFRFACFEYFYHCLVTSNTATISGTYFYLLFTYHSTVSPRWLYLLSFIFYLLPFIFYLLSFTFYLLPAMVLQWYSLSCESSLLR